MSLDEAELERLYGLPLEEFTKARNELAARLRRDGDREAADEAKALAKPTAPAWAANQLARTAKRELRALLDAGEALRKAQLGGAGPDELREATKAERDAVSRLRKKATGLVAPSLLDRVGETLRRAALSEPGLLERGLLVREPEATGFEALAGMKPASRQAARGRDSRAEERKRGAAEKRRAEEAKRRVRELRDEVRAREQELDAAARALERARDELAVAEERL